MVAVSEAQYPSCSLCLATLSSSFRGILRYSQARWDNPSSELWIVPWGPLPAGSGWIISKEKHPEGFIIRYPDQLSWLLEVNDQQLYSERPPDVWGTHCVSGWLHRLLGRNSFWLFLSTIPFTNQSSWAQVRVWIDPLANRDLLPSDSAPSSPQ